MKVTFLIFAIFFIDLINSQQFVNLFPGLVVPQLQAPQQPLPPVKRKGRPPNVKLHACCRKLPQADQECKKRFCDFNALSSNTVRPFDSETF